MIKSLLDTDAYKFFMYYAFLWVQRKLGLEMPRVLYKFKCRNNVNLLPYADRIRKQVEAFKKLVLKKDEAQYLMALNIFEPWFYVELMTADLSKVQVNIYEMEGSLHIDVEGPYCPAVLFEVPILAIVNEVYFSGKKNNGKPILSKKIEYMKTHPFVCIEFGTRRRWSFAWQDYVVKQLTKDRLIIGTSNVLLARKYGITPKGTQAHEFPMLWQALSSSLKDFQKNALEFWLLAFRGKLSVALSDTIGSDAFFKDFDNFLSNAYSGVRQDSGDPFEFAKKTIKHYDSLDIDPRTKNIIFSDSLTPKLAYALNWEVSDRINRVFGIGTNLTNDCGHEPLQIVMKLNKVNGQSVVKLSDSPGKAMYEDKQMVYRLNETFNLGLK